MISIQTCDVQNRHIKLGLNKALSEETRHLDLDAKHNPMLGWLLPWGTRRLRFNGDTEGMTLSVCSLPSLHTTSPLLLFFFSPKHRCRQTCLSCMHSIWAHTHTGEHIHTVGSAKCLMCALPTDNANLDTHTQSKIWQKPFDRWSQLEFELQIKTPVKMIFLLHEYWNWLMKWWSYIRHGTWKEMHCCVLFNWVMLSVNVE